MTLSRRGWESIEVDAVGVEVARASAEVAREQRLRGRDAIYVALAARRGLTPITLDEEQIARGGNAAKVRPPP